MVYFNLKILDTYWTWTEIHCFSNTHTHACAHARTSTNMRAHSSIHACILTSVHTYAYTHYHHHHPHYHYQHRRHRHWNHHHDHLHCHRHHHSLLVIIIILWLKWWCCRLVFTVSLYSLLYSKVLNFFPFLSGREQQKNVEVFESPKGTPVVQIFQWWLSSTSHSFCLLNKVLVKNYLKCKWTFYILTEPWQCGQRCCYSQVVWNTYMM